MLYWKLFSYMLYNAPAVGRLDIVLDHTLVIQFPCSSIIAPVHQNLMKSWGSTVYRFSCSVSFYFIFLQIYRFHAVIVLLLFFFLQALESFLLRCPRDISIYCDDILHLTLEYLSYDPNFTDNMEEDTDNDFQEEEDDEYVSWLSWWENVCLLTVNHSTKFYGVLFPLKSLQWQCKRVHWWWGYQLES